MKKRFAFVYAFLGTHTTHTALAAAESRIGGAHTPPAYQRTAAAPHTVVPAHSASSDPHTMMEAPSTPSVFTLSDTQESWTKEILSYFEVTPTSKGVLKTETACRDFNRLIDLCVKRTSLSNKHGLEVDIRGIYGEIVKMVDIAVLESLVLILFWQRKEGVGVDTVAQMILPERFL